MAGACCAAGPDCPLGPGGGWGISPRPPSRQGVPPTPSPRSGAGHLPGGSGCGSGSCPDGA
eukprot:14850755-Alexandrium_andersonii.AAC.1